MTTDEGRGNSGSSLFPDFVSFPSPPSSHLYLLFSSLCLLLAFGCGHRNLSVWDATKHVHNRIPELKICREIAVWESLLWISWTISVVWDLGKWNYPSWRNLCCFWVWILLAGYCMGLYSSLILLVSHAWVMHGRSLHEKKTECFLPNTFWKQTTDILSSLSISPLWRQKNSLVLCNTWGHLVQGIIEFKHVAQIAWNLEIHQEISSSNSMPTLAPFGWKKATPALPKMPHRN